MSEHLHILSITSQISYPGSIFFHFQTTVDSLLLTYQYALHVHVWENTAQPTGCS